MGYKNEEKQKAYQRAWRLANPGKSEICRRAWRLANPEKRRANDKAWRLANPEKRRAALQKYRRKKQNLKTLFALNTLKTTIHEIQHTDPVAS